MSSFKPMLAATVTDKAKLRFPYLASPKLDGIRCIVRGGEVLSRSLKPIRNKFVVSKLQGLPDLDGELIVGDPYGADVFNRTTRGVMSAEGEPQFKYHVFDTLARPYLGFYYRLEAVPSHPYIEKVEHALLQNLNDLGRYEDMVLRQGYEGVILRGPNSAYKRGRATATENSLWKLKQFTDGELLVMTLLEGVVNMNAPTKDALGETVRSMKQEGMQASGKVGTIVGTDLKSGQRLEISPGRMTHDERRFYWENQQLLLGKVVKYKCFGYGCVDAPRFATYQGLRDLTDL